SEGSGRCSFGGDPPKAGSETDRATFAPNPAQSSDINFVMLTFVTDSAFTKTTLDRWAFSIP
ncbi:MAG TPA: hypothetical protein VJ884_00310, partial [Salinibacter sp.]|nr:hypothetical protein [Salinibacter sp.]